MTSRQGGVCWFTGLPAAGKTTLARRVAELLEAADVRTLVLDGDELRAGLNSDLGFSPTDRAENVRRVGEVAKIVAKAGLVALSALVSPYREDRARVRARVGPEGFCEVFVDAPLEVCRERDPKGLYARAQRGEVRGLTGVDAPYEPPLSADLVVRTAEEPLEQCAERVLGVLRSRGWIGST